MYSLISSQRCIHPSTHPPTHPIDWIYQAYQPCRARALSLSLSNTTLKIIHRGARTHDLYFAGTQLFIGSFCLTATISS